MAELPDSGVRATAATGSLRERAPGKGRFDLVSPLVLTRLALRQEDGAIKYPDGDGRNWERGQPLSWFLDGLRRHLNQWHEGHTDEDHLAGALWNLHCLIHTEEMIQRGLLPAELDDVPHYLPEEPTFSEQVRSAMGIETPTLCTPPPVEVDHRIHRSYRHSGDARLCYRLVDSSEPWRQVIGDTICPRPHDMDQRD